MTKEDMKMGELPPPPSFNIGDKVAWTDYSKIIGHVTNIYFNRGISPGAWMVRVDWDISNPFNFRHLGVHPKNLTRLEMSTESRVDAIETALEKALDEVEKLKKELDEAKKPLFEHGRAYRVREKGFVDLKIALVSPTDDYALILMNTGFVCRLNKSTLDKGFTIVENILNGL